MLELIVKYIRKALDKEHGVKVDGKTDIVLQVSVKL